MKFGAHKLCHKRIKTIAREYVMYVFYFNARYVSRQCQNVNGQGHKVAQPLSNKSVISRWPNIPNVLDNFICRQYSA